MAIEHKNISDSQRHEPKGISTATVNQVYAADGAGSGEWRELPYSDTVILADVSAASSILMPIPTDVTIQSIRFTLFGAITIADSTISVTRGGDSASLGSQVIAQSGSAEGTTFDLTPSGNNTLTASTNKYLKFASDGASSTTMQIAITIKAKVV